MATHARQQYFADEVSLQKDSREFSIADEVQQKIDGIEEGAQVNVIETVKVNGEPLTPDEDKAVDITVPGVIDNLYSTSVSDALSARQGKVLYDYLQNIASRGRYLSNWNCATGLAMTNPEESPYEYKAGDYYTVSDVAASGGTNYRPDGSEYIIGQASTVVETEDVSVSDLYLYDGTNWLLLGNSGRTIAVDSSLSTTSTNPVENRVITNALNGKADATDTNTKTFYLSNIDDLTTAQAAYDWYTAGKNPIIMYGNSAFMMYRANASTLTFRNDEYTVGAYDSQKSGIKNRYIEFQLSNGTVTSIRDNWIWLGNPFLDTYTNYSIPYTPLYDGSPATKKYVDDHAGTTYTAGANVQISAQNVISATDTKYTAGTGISIDANNVISNTQTSAEWGNITGTLSNQTDLQNALDGKVNLGLNKVFDSTTVEIGKWVDEGGMQGSGHHVTIDPNGEVSAYNVTSGGYNEAKLGTDGLTLLENSALGGDETTVISQDGITITEGQTTQTYNFLGNDRIAKLSDVSGVTADVNTKTFYLSGNLQSAESIAAAQAAYDWYLAGKNPLIYYSLKSYSLETVSSSNMFFYANSIGNEYIKEDWIMFDITGSSVDSISAGNYRINSANTKTFTLPSSLSSQDALDVAQEAFDWYMDGKTPIIRRENDFNVYMCVGKNQSGLISPISYWLEFHNVRIGDGTVELGNYHMPSSAVDAIIRFTYDVNTNEVTQVESIYNQQDFLPTNSTTQVQYTPTRNRDPATKKYVDDNVVQKSAIAPSSPTEGMVWYDTTNDVLKVYDGTNWNEVGSDVANINTKTFYLATDSDYATAKEIYDWVYDGGYTGRGAIVQKGGFVYQLEYVSYNQVIFSLARPRLSSSSNSYSLIEVAKLSILIDSDTGDVMSIDDTLGTSASLGKYLRTDIDYSSPYTPLYNGSPVTKKYVDDRAVPTSGTTGYVLTKNSTGYEWAAPSGGDVIVSSQSGNILTSGMKIWAGTQANYESLGTYDNNTVYLTI